MTELCIPPQEEAEDDLVGGSFDEYLASVEAGLDDDARRLLQAFRGQYNLASQLMTLRKEAGLSQVQVAERAGLHQSTVNRVERGHSNLSQGALERIGAVFGARLAFVPMRATLTRAGFPRSTRPARLAH